MPMKIRIYHDDLHGTLLSLNVYQDNWDITDEENTVIPKEAFEDLETLFDLVANELRTRVHSLDVEHLHKAAKTLISLIA